MDPYTLDQPDQSKPQGFHSLLRFLRVVNRHRLILIGLIAAGAFLAVVRHKRIPKQYEASAKLMIRQFSTDPRSQTSSAVKGALASYKQLLLSDQVLAATADEVETLPPELAGESDRLLWPVILRDMLTVTFETDEHVLEIRCRSVNPESTAGVINALRAASEVFMENYQRDLSIQMMDQLRADRLSVETELRDKENLLLQARRDCGDIAINEGSDESHPLVQRVSHLNGQLTTLQSRRLELRSALNSAETLVTAQADLTPALQKLESIVGSEAVSRVPGAASTDPAEVETLRSELAVMQTELVARTRHYGSGHSEIIRRQKAIQGQQARLLSAEKALSRQINVGIRDPNVGRWIINTLQAALISTEQHELAVQGEYTTVEQDALVLSNKLAGIQLAEREVDALSELRSSLLNRLNSINIEKSGGRFRVAPLSDPMVPSTPSYPVLSTIMIIFCAGAAALGIGIIYVIDLMDDRLRSPEEVREELGLPVLGIIRRLPEEELEQAKIYLEGFPQTPHAECFRTLKTAITLSPMDSKCLAVTSTEASEGKTTTTVNLAAAYAQTGKRTLLIDADMRRPGLSRLLDVRGHGGLSEILRAETGVAELCRDRVASTDVPLLDVLPCGPRILNAGVLLSMPSLSDLLDWAVSEYDQVIIDCPPTLPVSDAAMVGRFVDGLLFLMNPDKAHRRSVSRAVGQLRSMGLKILGVVANTSLSDDSDNYGYQYGYGYGYSSQYGYGHDEDVDSDEDYPSESSETATAA